MKGSVRDSPLAMVVESVHALVAVATMATAFVHMKLAEEAESLVRRRPRCSFALKNVQTGSSQPVPVSQATTVLQSSKLLLYGPYIKGAKAGTERALGADPQDVVGLTVKPHYAQLLYIQGQQQEQSRQMPYLVEAADVGVDRVFPGCQHPGYDRGRGQQPVHD